MSAPTSEGSALDRASAAGIEIVRRHAEPWTGSERDRAALLARIVRGRFALLGEASHGSDDFYRERIEITKRLITDHGFIAVAAEADWPDAYRVNRYVRAHSDDRDANAALSGFKRFPAWMWRNTAVLDFVHWLRAYNDTLPPARKVGFYGIDLYSLAASIEAVLDYLDGVDPAAAGRARYRYSCFDHYGEDTQAYGYAAAFGLDKSCEDEVVRQLQDLTQRSGDAARRDSSHDADALFYAQQNARLVQNAERYYRTMFQGRVSSWNLRDRHMVETLDALDRHLSTPEVPARIAVWAHNSHLGDARATEMGEAGEINVGQLMRERHGNDVALVGFTTHHGTVTAASDWGGPPERKRVRPALPQSYEALFHALGVDRFALMLDEHAGALAGPHLERAIGVIYLPETERISHYFRARLTRQFDAVLHFDETDAVEPLERGAEWPIGEAPETYPTGV